MVLWTLQPEAVYHAILNSGVYRCDFTKSHMNSFKAQYDWLADQMRQRIGSPPVNVDYPVWAWFAREGRRKRPDLRRERWANGWKGDRFVSLEIEIPDNMVLLSDFDSWSLILLDGLLSETEQEGILLDEEYASLSDQEQQKYKSKNWERVFDLSELNNEWTTRGSSIQATFWELKREQIKNARLFVSAAVR